MTTLRDRLWIWGHDTGSHDTNPGVPGPSRITPVEAAHYMGIPNLLMVSYNERPKPPFGQYALPMRSLRSVVWSILGAGGSTDGGAVSDTDHVLKLRDTLPNLTGAIMDDFFVGQSEQDRPKALRSTEEISSFRNRLRSGPHPLDLWVVIYDFQLLPEVAPYLELCDVITFWTWKAANLDRLEERFAQLEKLAPRKRKLLGCYMWDYGGGGKPIALAQMEHQFDLGLGWLRAGRIEGIVALATCICDVGLEAVEWTREWVRKVGDKEL